MRVRAQQEQWGFDCDVQAAAQTKDLAEQERSVRTAVMLTTIIPLSIQYLKD